MAKKSSNRRSGGAGRSQSSTATLVRAKPVTELNAANSEASTTSAPSAPKPKPTTARPSAASIVRDTPARPAAKLSTTAKATAMATPVKSATPVPATKPATPASAAKSAAPTAASRQQSTRLARAKATQQARKAGQISAENYSYVVRDLRLVAAVAIGAVIILLAMTFVLAKYPNFLLFGH